MNKTLRDNIVELNRVCSGERIPTDSLKQSIAPFCQKRYIFDIISAFAQPEMEISSDAIELLVDLFSNSEARWAWLFLCALQPPCEDPVACCPELYDYHYFQIMLKILQRLDLSSGEFQSLAEYPLLISVDGLLMSGAFWGCGSGIIKQWQTQEFYEHLLARENVSDVEAECDSIELTENFISSVAQLFKKHHLEQLRLAISSAASYYGRDERVETAKCNFFDWLLSENLDPFLLEMVHAGFLVPENGLLLPNKEKIHDSVNEESIEHSGMFGVVDLIKLVSGLGLILKEQYHCRDELTSAFMANYFRWHESFGLMDGLRAHFGWNAHKSDEEQCIEVLLNPSVPIEEKAATIAHFRSWYESFGTTTGMGVRGGRSFASQKLFAALPKDNENARLQLKGVINEISQHNKRKRREHDDEKRALADELRSLEEGTAILIYNQGREDLVRLVEVKRTRFVCEYPDGRRYSMPAENFISVSDDATFKPLPDKIRQQRDLVRYLAGSRYRDQAKDKIVKQGIEILQALLDELAAALDRIQNAPVGLSSGVLGASLGPIKKVNPRDQALVKRILEVIAEIAKRASVKDVRSQIEKYPNADVQDRCTGVIDKLER